MKKLIILFIILLVIGAYLIKSDQDLDMENKQDQKTLVKDFTSWVGELFSNFRQVTSLAVNLDWLPETNKTKE